MSTAIWDDRLLPRARAQAMAGGWESYEETHLRCGHLAHVRDEAQLGRTICGQSMGVLKPDTTDDDRLSMVVRHMVMAHDCSLSGTGEHGD